MLLSLIILISLLRDHPVASVNSYIYLNDKIIQEEVPVGSFIIDLNEELTQYRFLNEQYTFLDDLNTHAGPKTYFLIDLITGRITSKRYLDRESMCANRHCSSGCNSNQTYCKMNLKVLLMPSSNIISLNIQIEDINDNKPLFRKERVNFEIAENVPLGHRIPLELAFDPDSGLNTIQRYELLPTNQSVFQLVYDSKEPQLYLNVIHQLDREIESEYSLTIIAYDGGVPSFNGRCYMQIKILDINDNSPQFSRHIYRFYLQENSTIGSLIGQVNANDKDEGLNGLVKYHLVGNTRNSSANVFSLNSETGELRLNRVVDYEDESYYNLIVEARDCGLGSLPAYATIELYVVDVNDNRPEISVSYLSTIAKDISGDGNVTVFMSENNELGKFIAHVSIADKDSQIKWLVLVDGRPLLQEDFFKLSLLNNNSFTFNTGTKTLDREKDPQFNISIKAWDPDFVTYYNFTINLIDENDNSPKFEQSSFFLAIYENNSPNDIITQFYVRDEDQGDNGKLSYEVVGCNKVEIDSNGVLRASVIFDREIEKSFNFTVISRDHGTPQLSSSIHVTFTILDRNDNYPQICYIVSPPFEINSNLTSNKTLYLNVSSAALNSQLGRNLIKLNYNDPDMDINSNSIFRIVEYSSSNFGQKLPFRLTHDGKLIFYQRLLINFDIKFHIGIICENENNANMNSSLIMVLNIHYEANIKHVDELINHDSEYFSAYLDDDDYYFDVELMTQNKTSSKHSENDQKQYDGYLILLLFILLVIILVTFISLTIMIYYYKKYKAKLLPVVKSSNTLNSRQSIRSTKDCLYYKNDSANQLLLGSATSSSSQDSHPHRLSLSLQSTKSDQSTSITDSFLSKQDTSMSLQQVPLYTNPTSLFDRTGTNDYDEWSLLQQHQLQRHYSYKSSQV